MKLFRSLMTILITCLCMSWSRADEPPQKLQQIAPGVLRTSGLPAAYVLFKDGNAVVVGCPNLVTLEDLKPYGIDTCKLVLLTHYHRDSSAGAESWIARGVAVRAPKQSAPWLTPQGVTQYWNASLPEVLPGEFPPLFHRQWAVWAFWVHSVGIEGIHCDLEDDASTSIDGWTIRVVATPGHTPDHVSYLAEPVPSDGRRIVFCGDAICAPGKIWTPYTTDWHHATDEGLVKAAESLRRVASLRPTLLCPEHGPPLHENIQSALEQTVLNLQSAATLKSFERFRQQQGPDVSLPQFLAPDQVGSSTPAGNTKPWTKLSPHLFLTGNTYALASKDGPVLLVDPYDRGLQQRLDQLRQDYHFGPAEVALITHAHNDHYTGIFTFKDEDRLQVWTLGRMADVIGSPNRFRAPYVDPRPVRVHRQVRDGETVAWREYQLRFEHQPGQTDFAMSIEVEVDGHRVLFTGDNFYRADQFSGSGGWSGLNRGLPHGYLSSIRRLIDRNPAWILAEHGGAMVFTREDFELRKRWAESAIAAADALSPSGDHRVDWDPHRVRIEPVRLAAEPGQALSLEVVAANPTANPHELSLIADDHVGIRVEPIVLKALPSQETRRKLEVKLAEGLTAGRHVLTFHGTRDGKPDPADVFVVFDVKPKR